jgi:hypothetical protein
MAGERPPPFFLDGRKRISIINVPYDLSAYRV